MLKNLTSKKIIVKNVAVYKNIFQKAQGLMFSKKNAEKAVIFEFKEEQRVALHMWFVFYAIDVFYLDKNKKVIEIKRNFRPFDYYSPKKKATFVIEVVEGKSNSVKIGDKLGW